MDFATIHMENVRTEKDPAGPSTSGTAGHNKSGLCFGWCDAERGDLGTPIVLRGVFLKYMMFFAFGFLAS